MRSERLAPADAEEAIRILTPGLVLSLSPEDHRSRVASPRFNTEQGVRLIHLRFPWLDNFAFISETPTARGLATVFSAH